MGQRFQDRCGRGADSFLDLRDDDEATRTGIDRIIRENVYMPEWVSGAGQDEYNGPEEPPGLTRREREVFRLVGIGNGR
jgi:DNA-binding NarL/FixJ family response regulator